MTGQDGQEWARNGASASRCCRDHGVTAFKGSRSSRCACAASFRSLTSRVWCSDSACHWPRIHLTSCPQIVWWGIQPGDGVDDAGFPEHHPFLASLQLNVDSELVHGSYNAPLPRSTVLSKSSRPFAVGSANGETRRNRPIGIKTAQETLGTDRTCCQPHHSDNNGHQHGTCEAFICILPCPPRT